MSYTATSSMGIVLLRHVVYSNQFNGYSLTQACRIQQPVQWV